MGGDWRVDIVLRGEDESEGEEGIYVRLINSNIDNNMSSFWVFFNSSWH